MVALPLGMTQKAAADNEPRMQRIFDDAVFYDGYRSEVVDADLDDGILRHANHLYARRLTDSELDWIGSDFRMKVVIRALCDNYDRIGNINLALVPKGSESYDIDEVDRLELGRFITPFMNKNAKLKEVPYEYSSDAISLIFRDSDLREKYDYWMEFELFGVPYAANQQIAGCADRNDVFKGTLDFECSGAPAPRVTTHRLVPIVIKRPESKGHNLNNYSERGTDTIGTCTKTYHFEVKEQLADARVTLIMSNHGANSYGEEYNRRKHLVYVDGELVLVFKPGGKSCEPYRQYNTQVNGIYGRTPMTESQWTSWNNWCPGDIIPIRDINLGELGPGEHTVMIRVPEAQFNEGQGDFPVSMYLQGLTEGVLPAESDGLHLDMPELEISVREGVLTLRCADSFAELEVYDNAGVLRYGTCHPQQSTDLSRLPGGVYVVVATDRDGRLAYRKVML